MKIRKEWLKIFLGDSNCTLCHTFMIHSLGILFNPNLNVCMFVTVVVQFNIEFKWLSSREFCNCPWRTFVCLAKPIAKSEANSNSPISLILSACFICPDPGLNKTNGFQGKCCVLKIEVMRHCQKLGMVLVTKCFKNWKDFIRTNMHSTVYRSRTKSVL